LIVILFIFYILKLLKNASIVDPLTDAETAANSVFPIAHIHKIVSIHNEEPVHCVAVCKASAEVCRILLPGHARIDGPLPADNPDLYISGRHFSEAADFRPSTVTA
jgi:hypothetical protein